jgi:SAM-dependent methyltransferase
MSYIHTEDVHNKKAAREIVPCLISIVSPKSVVDVGCGIGTWLSVFEENNIDDILGIDGNYVNKELMKIDLSKFIALNLNNLEKETISVSRKFDLAICLEVAEHLEASSADILIRKLTELSNVVVFSAAVPNQGGQGHINEQSPSYWQEKFRQNNFELFDSLRWKFWSNVNVDWWYKQNIFIGVKKGVELPIDKVDCLVQVIHPELYNARINQLERIDSRLKETPSNDISTFTAFKIFVRSLKRDFVKSFSKN